MATFVQRMQAIGDALVNGVATPTQLNELGEALYNISPEAWAELTNAQKAEETVKRLRRFANNAMRQYKDELARRAISNDADQLPEQAP